MEMKAGLWLRFVTANPRDILNEKFSMKDRNHLNDRKNTSENYKKKDRSLLRLGRESSVNGV